MPWNRKIPIQYLLIQIRGIWILEWKIAAYQSKQNNSTAPNIYIRAMILFTRNHLGSGVTW